MDIFNIVGFTGVALYLVSYYLLSTKRIDGNGRLYLFLNLMGASFVLVSLFKDFNAPSFITQSCWIIISAYGIARITWLEKKLKKNS